MKTKFVLLLIAATAFLSGCDATQNDLLSEKDNTIETLSINEQAEIFLEEKQDESSTSKIEDENTIDINNLSEEDFKNMCAEITYNDIDKSFIGKFVTKEILFTSSERDEYQCASSEDYIEDYLEYQHSYRIYDIFDCRFDKSFQIQSNDVIRIYGIITDVKTNYANGLDYPIIDMYYIDYIRKWREPVDDTKSMVEIKQERIAERKKIKEKNDYFNSLNSDYTGITKNVDNMDLLSEEEFKTSCDSMNFVNMVDSTEDLTGRYVKIHLQLTNHKIFASEESKRNRLGTFADIYSINDNVWYSRLYIERTDTYSSEPILLYFTNKNADTIEHLKTDNEIMVYGVVLDYELNDGFHNEFDFLAVYIEKI